MKMAAEISGDVSYCMGERGNERGSEGVKGWWCPGQVLWC